eukprot:1849418-Alexandrium_andersonii.AAC.1
MPGAQAHVCRVARRLRRGRGGGNAPFGVQSGFLFAIEDYHGRCVACRPGALPTPSECLAMPTAISGAMWRPPPMRVA